MNREFFWVGSACWIMAALAASASGQSRAVDLAVEIPRIWSAEQHVYVKGRLGVSKDKLDALEQWIDQNAPNWTVVLMNNADRESFQEAGGRRHTGMDAVEFALGQTLPNATRFGDLKHPETGEANGAYFLLFLEERKLSYFASEAYDRRNLGEDRWQGNLDAPAIRAMRGGGRIIDAAKDTITNIDGALARKLAAAEAEKKRAAERARMLREETAAVIQNTAKMIEVAERRAGELARELGDPSGDLARPDTASWSAAMAQAEEQVTAGEVAVAGRTAQKVRDEVTSYLAGLDAYQAAPAEMAAMQKRIEETQLQDESILSRTRLQEARDALTSSQQAHARADSSYRNHLIRSDNLLEEAVRIGEATAREASRLQMLQKEAAGTVAHPKSGEAVQALAAARRSLTAARLALGDGAHDISSHLDAAAGKLAATRRLSEALREREARVRTARITGGTVGALALLLIGVIGNRRRRDERREAHQLLETWDRTLKGKRDGLFALMDRAAVVVGSSADVEERGCRGETLRLAKLAIRDVDELFIMSSCVERIFDRAETLAKPANPLWRSVNFVAAARYKQAIRLLRDQPVHFEAGDQLEAIIRGAEKPNRAESFGLLGKKEDYEPFTMSFEELIAAFDEKASRALENLDVIEESWETIADRLSNLEAAISEIEAAEERLRAAAERDGLFALPPVFETLLPALLEHHDHASKMGASDPVQALRGPLAAGERVTRDATSLIAFAVKAHDEVIPALRTTGEGLTVVGRNTSWVEDTLGELSSQADDWARRAKEAEISSEITTLTKDLDALKEALEDALALENEVSSKTLSDIEEAKTRILKSKASLGAALELPPEKVLSEEDLDPSEFLRRSDEEVEHVRSAIDRGAIQAARGALAQAEHLVEDANHLVERTLEIHKEFEVISQSSRQRLDTLEGELPDAIRLVGELEANYAATALELDHAHDNDNARSLRDVMELAQQAWSTGADEHASARGHYQSGRLLQAADLLDSCAERSALVEECLAGVRERDEALKTTSRENVGRFQELEERIRGQAALADQFHATSPSRDAYRHLCESVDELRLPSAGAGRDDPFATQSRLTDLAHAADRFEAAVGSDKLLFEEASRSAEAAAKELEIARLLAGKARTDGLADSAEVTQGLAAVDALEGDLREVRTRLRTAHEDWDALDGESDRIAADGARFAALLRGELRRAEAAARAISSAAQKAREATRWSGGYGVSILGAPGVSDLERARTYLHRGDYQAAHRLADQARLAAASAIADAVSEVARKRRAARRRRQAVRSSLLSSSRSSSSFGSRSSFGSSFGSRSSFGSSSGSSRSSFSSGSGTSRSGW